MKEFSFKIVQATPRNLYSIAVMTKKFFPYTTFGFEEIQKRMAKNFFYYAALFEGHTVGFVDFELKEDYAQIFGLAVLQEFRGKGIGQALLKKAVSAAKSEAKKRRIILQRIDLLVLEENDAAKKLYEKYGFLRKGILDKELWGKRILVYSKMMK